MTIPFYKYQGAGNDFVILDQREHTFLTTRDQTVIERMCDRRFGVGADGLMWIEQSDSADFKMVYFNSDGRQSSMCGNGGRCIVALATKLGIFEGDECQFTAIDGLHEARILQDGQISLQMKNVSDIQQIGNAFVLDTGSPHYVRFVENIDDWDMLKEGRAIRYGDRFSSEGINVNLVEEVNGVLKIRTYERGVENETLACGTGVTAASLVAGLKENHDGDHQLHLQTRGGLLTVSFNKSGHSFSNIRLIGPAVFVFEGIWKKPDLV